MPTASLAQVLTTLLIYYGQGDRVAGVTLPWTREETPKDVSLPPPETQVGTGGRAPPPGVWRGCPEWTGPNCTVWLQGVWATGVLTPF